MLGGAGQDGVPLASCEVYSPSTDTWTEIEPMMEPRQYAACVVLDGLLVVIGGSDGVKALDSCEATAAGRGRCQPTFFVLRIRTFLRKKKTLC